MSIFKKTPPKNSDILPACEICENSAPIAGDSEERFLCRFSGVVSGDHSCKKFFPDPLKRRPPPRAVIAASVSDIVADSAEVFAEFNAPPAPPEPPAPSEPSGAEPTKVPAASTQSSVKKKRKR